MTQASAKDIAIAIDDTNRCACGKISTSKYSCESTNCNSEFCFQCLQKYIHGRTVLEHKFCEDHYYAEIDCLDLDEDFRHWESKLGLTLRSIKFMEWCIKYSSFFKVSAIVIGLLTISGGALGGALGLSENLDGALDPDGEEISEEEVVLGSIVTGALFIGGGFLFGPMCLSSKAASEGRVESLINAIPDNNPPERPKIASRNLPIFTDELVKSYLVLIGK